MAAEWDGEYPDLRIRYWSSAGLREWSVRLMQSRRGHLRFRCPILQITVDDLYLWRGRLGSRSALALRYPCQQIGSAEWTLMKGFGAKPADLGHDAMAERRYARDRPPPDIMQAQRSLERWMRREERRRAEEEAAGAVFRWIGFLTPRSPGE